MKKILYVFIPLIAVLCLSMATVYAETEKSVSMSQTEELSQAYGYCLGQQYSIERIKKEYPNLSQNASIAQLEFDRTFKPSYDNIAGNLRKLMKTKWAAYEKDMASNIHKMSFSRPLSEAQAEAFLQEVRSRAKGNIETPVIETLLTNHPFFQKNPGEEFARGFVKTFRTGSHPKTKGVDFHIQYPMSWRAKEGQRSNVIQIMTSENGRGRDSIVLMVKDIPLPAGYQISNKERDEFFTEAALKEMAPEGAKLIKAQPIVLENLKAGMMVFDQEMQRIDQTILMRNLHYILLVRDKLVFVQCMTGEISKSRSAVVDRFNKMEPLFKLIGNSLVIHNR